MAYFLFPDDPPYAVNYIAFPATIGTNDPGDVLIEVNYGFICKGLESLNL